jgi:hypothetical protein
VRFCHNATLRPGPVDQTIVSDEHHRACTGWATIRCGYLTHPGTFQQQVSGAESDGQAKGNGISCSCICAHGTKVVSWALCRADRNPKAEFQEERIRGAQFFDVDMIADTESGLPHMLPSEAAFAAAADALGITNDSQVGLRRR